MSQHPGILWHDDVYIDLPCCLMHNSESDWTDVSVSRLWMHSGGGGGGGGSLGEWEHNK